MWLICHSYTRPLQESLHDSGYDEKSGSRLVHHLHGSSVGNNSVEKENASPVSALSTATPSSGGVRRGGGARKSLASNWPPSSSSSSSSASALASASSASANNFHPHPPSRHQSSSSSSVLTNPETPSKSLLGAADGGDSSLLFSPPAILKDGVGTLTPPDESKHAGGSGQKRAEGQDPVGGGEKEGSPPKSKVV